ncbi:MAG: NAD-binding protein [Planctomycetes bacterium]|nr:NAD-binding protein [Planctomycetota bacterium]NBY02940.1 NAD-binding protein [Planctomycetota bacterium]
MALQIFAIVEQMMVKPNIKIDECASQIWDVIIVGAGPAGGLAAILLARKKLQVLLVDRQTFPRPKVCGCCLNGNALSTLKEVGLFHLISENQAMQLHEMRLGSRKVNYTFPLSSQVALSRERLDSTLINKAMLEGAFFLDATLAEMGQLLPSSREVILKQEDHQFLTKAKIVLAADGLGGGLLVRKNITTRLKSNNSRIGAGVTLLNPPDFYKTGTLFMISGNGGYLGLVRLEDGRLDLAAAFDPIAIKIQGGMGPLAKSLLQEMNWPLPLDIEYASWKGTPALTTKMEQVAAERLFAIGDSAGYIEPFTGEGMAWAFTGANFVAPLIAKGVAFWEPELAKQWALKYKSHIASRQGVCKTAAFLLRWPLLVKLALLGLKVFPFLSKPVVAMLDKPSKATTRI